MYLSRRRSILSQPIPNSYSSNCTFTENCFCRTCFHTGEAQLFVLDYAANVPGTVLRSVNDGISIFAMELLHWHFIISRWLRLRFTSLFYCYMSISESALFWVVLTGRDWFRLSLPWPWRLSNKITSSERTESPTICWTVSHALLLP